MPLFDPVPPSPDLGASAGSVPLPTVGGESGGTSSNPYPGTVPVGGGAENVAVVANANAIIAPYTTYQIKVDYILSSGNLQLPVAPLTSAGQQPAEIVQTRLPYGRKVVTWVASRKGALPVLPSPFVTDTNLILADALWGYISPRYTNDFMTRIYRAAGVYTYHELNPVAPGLGTPMFMPVTDIEGTVGPIPVSDAQFVTSLVG